MNKMKKGNKKATRKPKNKGIAPFVPNVKIKVIKDNPDGSFVGRIIPKYKATLKILGKIYTSEGETVDEVLNGFKCGGWTKGAGVLSIEKDGVIREKIIAGNHIKNLFGMASGTMREVSLKWVRSLFT